MGYQSIVYKLGTSEIINDSLSNLLTGISDVDKLKEHESLVNKLKQLMGRKLALRKQEAAKNELRRVKNVRETNKTRPGFDSRRQKSIRIERTSDCEGRLRRVLSEDRS